MKTRTITLKVPMPEWRLDADTAYMHYRSAAMRVSRWYRRAMIWRQVLDMQRNVVYVALVKYKN